MTKPMIRIHNTETDEVIDREMNDVEFAKYEIDLAQIEAEKKAQLAKIAEAEAKAQAKAAAESKLAALGLTTDDLRALGL
jgi:predicted RNA-binding protein Jag